MSNRITAFGDALLAVFVPSVQAEAASYSCGGCQCRQWAGPYCIQRGRWCCETSGTYCWWMDC